MNDFKYVEFVTIIFYLRLWTLKEVSFGLDTNFEACNYINLVDRLDSVLSRYAFTRSTRSTRFTRCARFTRFVRMSSKMAIRNLGLRTKFTGYTRITRKNSILRIPR